jgi:hypothetical protein
MGHLIGKHHQEADSLENKFVKRKFIFPSQYYIKFGDADARRTQQRIVGLCPVEHPRKITLTTKEGVEQGQSNMCANGRTSIGSPQIGGFVEERQQCLPTTDTFKSITI